MRATAVLVCCLILPLSVVPEPKAADGVPAPPLRFAQCLDPTHARSWINTDDRHLLVDAGRYRYRIKVSPACTALRYSQFIAFRGDPVMGRVCGGLGDAVITRDYPCRIERMDLLNKQQYQQAVDDREAARKAREAALRSKAP